MCSEWVGGCAVSGWVCRGCVHIDPSVCMLLLIILCYSLQQTESRAWSEALGCW